MPVSDSLPPSAQLLERDEQMARLRATLDAAAEGNGASVVVVGEGGAGKTTLLAEIARTVQPRLHVLRARGDELEQDYPFGVVRQLLDAPLRTVDDRDAVFAGPAALARGVFEPGGDAAGQEDSVFARQEGLYWLTVQLSERLGPLALIVDDCQRADESSVRFLRFLGNRLEGVPVAQVIATRPADELHGESILARMLDDPGYAVVPVDRLSLEATTAYVADAWGAVAGRLGPAFHELTTGNPLLLRALVAEAQRQGLDPARADAGDLAGLGVRSVGQRVERMLAESSPAAIAVAQAVAVLGDAVAPQAAIQQAEIAPAEGGPALDTLLHLGVLEEGIEGLRFVHPLVRTSVHQLMRPVARESAHARAARRLHAEGAGAEEVAAHLVVAGPVGEEWAGPVLEQAASRALELGVPETAARFLTRAVEESGEDARRLALLAHAESHAGAAGALAHFERAAEVAGSPEARRGIELQYAGALAMAGETTRAFAVLRDAGAGDEPEDRATLHAAALFADSDGALAYRDEVAAVPPDALGASPGERLLAATTAFELALRGQSAGAVAGAIVPATQGPGLPLDLRAASAWGYGIWALMLAERGAEARAECDRAVQHGRTTGQLVLLALGLCLRAGVHLRRGSLLLAEADCRESLELAVHPSWRFGAAACTQFLVDILIEQGRLADARTAYEALEPRQRNSDTISVDVLLRACHARLLLAERQPDRALAEALVLRDRRAQARFECAVHAPWRPAAAGAWLALGDHEQALSTAAEHVEEVEAFGAPVALADALLGAAGLAGDDERGPLLERALAAAREGDSPLALAKVLVARARAERVAGSPEAAREPAHEASRLASECGAVPVVDAAVDELAASGAKPRRRGGAGAHLLTASESRIARLAADGASNREIAQTLFVTQKTVEMHLTSAYRKLDISSRAQLAARLDDEPAPA